MKLLMLGSNNCSMEMLEYAREKGIYTIVTDSFPPEHSVAKLYADEYWMIDTADTDYLEQKCREHSIDAIVCGISEFNQDRVIELTGRLGLPCYCSESAWSYGRDKSKFKKICQGLGISTPREFSLNEIMKENSSPETMYPLVVKPVDMCSNRGVVFCSNRGEVYNAVQNIRSLSANSKIIIEKKIQGKEFLALYALAEGKASLVTLYACHHQHSEPSYCYSVNTTAHESLDKYLNEFDSKAIELMETIGCTDGMCWIELILDIKGQFNAIEMGYRLPGDMIFLSVKEICGFDSVGWIVDSVCGKKHMVSELPEAYQDMSGRYATSYMLWTNMEGEIAEVTGLEKLSELPCKLVVKSADAGETIEAYRPLYTITFEASEKKEIYEMIQKINSTIHVKNTKGKEMLIYFTDFCFE